MSLSQSAVPRRRKFLSRMPRGKEGLLGAHVGTARPCWASADRGAAGVRIRKWHGPSPSRTLGPGPQNKWSHRMEQIRSWQEGRGRGVTSPSPMKASSENAGMSAVPLHTRKSRLDVGGCSSGVSTVKVLITDRDKAQSRYAAGRVCGPLHRGRVPRLRKVKGSDRLA